jgi:hypothetical protein
VQEQHQKKQREQLELQPERLTQEKVLEQALQRVWEQQPRALEEQASAVLQRPSQESRRAWAAQALVARASAAVEASQGQNASAVGPHLAPP